jgi:PAS domain S-box-containing protein
MTLTRSLAEEGTASSSPTSSPGAAEPRPAEEPLGSPLHLMQTLTQLHAELVTEGAHHALFERLLALMLELTRSESGLIAELQPSPGSAPSLRLHASTRLTWADAPREPSGQSAPAGLERSELEAHLGAVLTSGKPVRLLGPGSDSQQAPPGAPRLRTFLGLPFQIRDEVVGVVGLANRPGGYDEALLGLLQPVLTTCGTLLHAWRDDERRRHAERTLLLQQAQMKKLALVAARTDNAVIITDARGRTEWVNEGFTRITGFTLEELLGRKPGELLQGAGTDPRGVEAMRQAIHRGEGITVELLNYGKSGRPYWNLIEIQPVRDEQGQLVQFVAIESDVTARRELEQQAAWSAEQLRLALESAEDGLWDWDMRTGSLTVSPRWLRMLGHDETTLKPSLSVWSEQLCHPEDLPEANRRLREHHEGRSPMYEFEHRLRHREGGWVWVLGRAKVVERDEQGRPLRMVGTNVDITSRKLAQERLQSFIHAIPDMIFRVRVDGICLGFKPSTLDAPLFPPEEFVGKNLYAMPLPTHLLASLQAALVRVCEGSALEVFEYSIELPAGRLDYEARVVRSGEDEGMCIVRNVTARKAAESQSRRHQEELEERVRQATRELEARQAQLIQSEKLASLGQMAASSAHEINNPVGYVSSNLSTLASYTSVLRQLLGLYSQVEQALGDPPPGAVAALLAKVRALREHERLEELLQDMGELQEDLKEGVTRIREFIQDLKAFVREESGTPQMADLNRGLQVTLRMLRHELRHKCEVHCDFAPLPLVRCFPTQLNQVFTNMLLNAAQAIEQRGEIRLTTRQEGDEVVVRIQDSGHGMDARTLERLFTPFFTTKPAGQGTGLGLTICYAIISRHKGRIDVESAPGKGTTFTVRLPINAG